MDDVLLGLSVLVGIATLVFATRMYVDTRKKFYEEYVKRHKIGEK